MKAEEKSFSDQYRFTDKEMYTRDELSEIIKLVVEEENSKTENYKKQIEYYEKKLHEFEDEHGYSLGLVAQTEFQKLTLEDLNSKLEDAYAELDKISRTDQLTCLLNRRAIFEIAEAEVSRIIRYQARKEEVENNIQETKSMMKTLGILSVAMVDIDHFKKINDTYGHQIGDEVLKRVSTIFMDKSVIRLSDRVGRIGGEEFLILMPETLSDTALIPLKKICDMIRAERFDFPDFCPFNITISVGISNFGPDDRSIHDTIKRADAALYRAKNNGRDRIEIWENSNSVKV